MSSIVKKLAQKKLITPPSYLPHNIHYEVMMGSSAYGVSSDSSDIDVYGWCIPPKNVIFPHLDGHIEGFGKQRKRFEQFQQHHIRLDKLGEGGFPDGKTPKRGDREYDVSIYNIVKYFQLCMDNNPNMIDSLFVPDDCVFHITQVGQMVRDSRKLFLHRGAYHKFKGYAYSQLHKTDNVTEQDDVRNIWAFEEARQISRTTTFAMVREEMEERRHEYLSGLSDVELNEYACLFSRGFSRTKRFESIKIHGTDVKFLYHVVRLVDECEQILLEGDIDLRRNREQLKAIRRGEMGEQEIRDWFAEKEKDLEKLYHSSKLRYGPDENAIRTLLLQCLEHHYGSLDKCIVDPDKYEHVLRQIAELTRKTLGD